MFSENRTSSSKSVALHTGLSLSREFVRQRITRAEPCAVVKVQGGLGEGFSCCRVSDDFLLVLRQADACVVEQSGAR